MLRCLTHLMVLSAALAPISFTIASAHSAPGAGQGLYTKLPQSTLAAIAAARITRLSPAALSTADETPTTPPPDPTPPLPPIVAAAFAVAPVPGGMGAHFPWGYCTWYVSTRRNIPWSGNAAEWFATARSLGFSVGSTPRPGAIMVTRESWVGHVAFVESVDGGSFTVSEMNFRGFGVVNQRHVSLGRVALIGFIY